MIILGNKCDLVDYREVPEAEGREFAKQSNALFLETSYVAEDLFCRILFQLLFIDCSFFSRSAAQRSASILRRPSLRLFVIFAITIARRRPVVLPRPVIRPPRRPSHRPRRRRPVEQRAPRAPRREAAVSCCKISDFSPFSGFCVTLRSLFLKMELIWLCCLSSLLFWFCLVFVCFASLAYFVLIPLSPTSCSLSLSPSLVAHPFVVVGV